MGSFLPKARSFSSASRVGESETRRRMNRNANIHCNARHHSRLCRIARASPRAERGASPRFPRPINRLAHKDLCRRTHLHRLFSFCFPSLPKKNPCSASEDATKRLPHPIKNQILALGRQRTEEKPGKAGSGGARGVGKRIRPGRENVDIQKTSEKFCDSQIYP